MNAQDINRMTPEQIRRAIAERLGWFVAYTERIE